MAVYYLKCCSLSDCTEVCSLSIPVLTYFDYFLRLVREKACKRVDDGTLRGAVSFDYGSVHEIDGSFGGELCKYFYEGWGKEREFVEVIDNLWWYDGIQKEVGGSSSYNDGKQERTKLVLLAEKHKDLFRFELNPEAPWKEIVEMAHSFWGLRKL